MLLEGWGNEPLDVSQRHAIVEMNPLLIGVLLADDEPLAPAAEPSLVVMERSPAGNLGRVRLCPRQRIPLATSSREFSTLQIFAVEGCSNDCLDLPRLRLVYLVERWRLAFDNNPRNEKMSPMELFCMWVLYSYPRRVNVVSFLHPSGINMFPMDLASGFAGDLGILCFHRARPCLPLVREARKLAVCSVPVEDAPRVFGIGKNHQIATLDRRELPFETMPSPTFGIPVPQGALSIREVTVEEIHEVPRHQIVIGRTVSSAGGGAAMALVHRLYYQRLLREGRPMRASIRERAG
ncbi:MAG TPA: hypothetical protein DD490_02195 [Acidobacteria bacterium]|nr:hypothetical protein [Acidobacteriota bacterium]